MITTPRTRKERRKLVITSVLTAILTHTSVGGTDLGEVLLRLVEAITLQ